MSIKHHFVRLAEKITGRKCSRCMFNHGSHCAHPSDGMFMRCWHSITRPGFVTKNEGREPASAAAMDTSGMAPGDLTEQEKHELGKIVETLKEASATALDGGLLDNTEPRPIWEDKTESGMLEEE